MFYIVDLDGFLIISAVFSTESAALIALISYQKLNPYNTAQIVKGD